MTNKTTKQGTVLPVMDLKGKPYLQVAYRIVWFKEEQPEGSIRTELIEISPNNAVFKATICNANGNVIGTAHGSETKQGFDQFIEKAETVAIGRALAHAGYGTQFEPSLDAGDKLADSPVESAKVKTVELTPKMPTKVPANLKVTQPTNGAIISKSTKDLIQVICTKLTESSQITLSQFKDKYLKGGKLSELTEMTGKEVVFKLTEDFPGAGLV